MNIIELAVQAGMTRRPADRQCRAPYWDVVIDSELERFAAQVLEDAANIAERTPKMSAYDSNMAVQDYIAKKLRTEARALKGAKE